MKVKLLQISRFKSKCFFFLKCFFFFNFLFIIQNAPNEVQTYMVGICCQMYNLVQSCVFFFFFLSIHLFGMCRCCSVLHAFLKNCFNAFGDGHRLGGVFFFLQESSGLLSGSRGYRFFFVCVCCCFLQVQWRVLSPSFQCICHCTTCFSHQILVCVTVSVSGHALNDAAWSKLQAYDQITDMRGITQILQMVRGISDLLSATCSHTVTPVF